MKILRRWTIPVLFSLICCANLFASASAQEEKDRAALEQTSIAIRAAFARGDVAGVMAYHHPDVVKSLTFHTTQNGAAQVAAGLRSSFQQYRVEFVENRNEYLLIRGDTAIEQSIFTIRSIPNAGGPPAILRGRAMVVYVRYAKSPTGWASIREMIQPATE
jgi:ketosteroid isomerase-like protein